MTPSTASRRRLVEAMGLGPLWVRRTRAPMAVVDRPHDQVDTGDARALRIAALDWDPLRHDVAGCVACGLARSRTRTVFGAGASRVDWLIVGHAPAAEEDACGEPFAGQGGKLLDAMLAAVGIARERCAFLVNTVKCRPPDDRDPLPAEIASCRPYLERQITLLAPRLILVVGQAAARALLPVDPPLDELRGRRHDLRIGDRTIALVVTHAPDDLLDAGDRKAESWADLCLAREVFKNTETTA